MKRSSKFATMAVAASLLSALYGPQAFADDSTGKVISPAPSTAPKSDLELAHEKGAISGYPGDSDLHGSQYVTRGELVSMINRAAKLTDVTMKKAPFDDLESWQTQAIANAEAAGIVHGTENGHFEPNRYVTRQELAVLIGAAMNGGKTPNVNQNVLNYYKDKDTLSDWAKPFIAYATLGGVFAPTLDGAFNPDAPMTRSEAAKALKPLLFDVVDVLSTNDIHGHIETAPDKKRNNQLQGGMETIGGIVNDFRSVNPDHTVVVDGGDMWQGTLISNLFNGQSVMDTMADIKYDAAAIGNHEFDFGRDTLINNIKNAKFPILGANIIDDATGKRVDWTQPYTIVEKGGLKIGIIGFSTPQTTTTTKSTNIEGLSFVDPAPIAKDLSAELKAKGCDLVIVTSHLPGDQASASDKVMDELADLATGTGNGTLDAIIGGHSHKRVVGNVNGIPVIEAQNWTLAVGHIQLFVDKESKKVVSSSASLLETYTNLTTGDATVRDTVSGYHSKVEEKEQQVIATAGEAMTRTPFRSAIDGGAERDGVTPLGNIITDAMRSNENADVAFTNIGGIRADVDAGEITYGDMFSVLPFGNTDMIGTMTAKQIKSALEVLDKYSNLPAIQFSGLKVEWDNTRPTGDKYTKITLTDGTPVYVDGKFNESRTFKAVTNDFMATGTGDGFTVFGEVKDWKIGDVMLDAWIKYTQNLTKDGSKVVLKDDGRDIRTDLQK
ncbi:5'-nucleotidase C-terminal domain-containing protein [Tumebacillus flagellatus]|uniref:5'-nucleotidase n=1 Tax=Tumebacillus flagellatus TaxID=1157490 RepID=A0A074MB06_9BACL|nr:5'-nucleotidase C-terminal domain-containing protein [Tumebacillus flagellatus]KEO83092.1 5'-nucleotidase [Tumebacillus flagellatus]